jgi:succinoglycan biosynthesis protein ExoV
MKLAYFRSAPTNFGDELNAYIWHRILPEGFLDNDDAELFVGIGSILGEMFPDESHKYVFGSGIGGYIAPPKLESGRWTIVFVRGPRSAQALGLSADLSICDSAILLREVKDLPPPAEGVDVAFMPHFESVKRGRWREACEVAGLTFLDPTDPPEKLLSQIRGARLLITEAMHGAIVADALRVPWVAVQPLHKAHRAKWYDWAEALRIQIEWTYVFPSSLRESVTAVTGRGGRRLQNAKVFDSLLLSPFGVLITSLAAARLRRIARRASGQLSSDAMIREVTERARAAVDSFVASRKGSRAVDD